MAKFRVASVLLLSAAALQVNASEFNLGLNNDVVSTELELQVNKDVNAVLGYIYSDDSGHIAQGAMHMTHDAGVHHFEVGAKLSQLWADDAPNGSTVSVGGRYALALGPNISVHAAAYYAPSVLSSVMSMVNTSWILRCNTISTPIWRFMWVTVRLPLNTIMPVISPSKMAFISAVNSASKSRLY